MKKSARLAAALKIWIVIYPSITLFQYMLGARLAPLPLYQRTGLMTLVLVPWMLFAGIPLLERLLAKARRKNPGNR